MSYVAPDKEELARRGRDENGNPLKVVPAKQDKPKAKAKSTKIGGRAEVSRPTLREGPPTAKSKAAAAAAKKAREG